MATFLELSTDHGYFRTTYALIDDLVGLDSMRQLRCYLYGGEWIWPGWDYEGQKEGTHLIWFPLQSRLDKVTGALYIFHKKNHEIAVSLWTTSDPEPTRNDAIYGYVSTDYLVQERGTYAHQYAKNR
jgi:hypothetical protein